MSMPKPAVLSLTCLLATACGALPGQASGKACALTADCEAISVCVANVCTLAAGRTYDFRIRGATVPATDAQGLTWDPFFPEPDVLATLKVDLQELGSTAVAQDTTKPTWTDVLQAKVVSGARIEILLWDSDVQSNDLIDSFVAENAIAFVHAGGMSGPIRTGSATTLNVEVVPR
jgi:hypothetical protein